MKRANTLKAGKKARGGENPEWTRADLARAVPFGGLPQELQSALAVRKRGPQRAPRKVPVSIRLSADVVQALRDSGPRWQSRVDEILRTHIK